MGWLIRHSSVESSLYAEQQRNGGDTPECPPHDFYMLSISAEEIDGRKVKYRTDYCVRKGCNATHGYYVN